MTENYPLSPLRLQMYAAEAALGQCNELSAKYGLTLSAAQIQSLVQRRFEALKDTGRMEFGEGILPKLVYAFCDSPYISQADYEQTLVALQDAFYYFKNESMDRISDDELIDYMKSVFDGRAQGSLDYLSGTSLEELCRFARADFDPMDADETGDLF